ncbi:hypothetical protein PBY51_014333 [Eleginops maclovinus]|nr:hypothetical protein PBY51_014333 [Eleginops maclovinus]
MLGVAALSLFLNVLDFICAIKRSVRQKTKRKLIVEKIYEEEQCFHSGRGATRVIDPNASLAQQDQETEAGPTGSFRKRRASKGSCAGLVLASGQEPACLERASLSHSPSCNTNGNNVYSVTQEEALERNGSEVALCPAEPMGTPRSIRVSKHNRLKPPPPPRRDFGSSSRLAAGPFGEISTATSICTRRMGQYTLVELASGTELQTSEDGQEKRSEWV